MNRFLRHIGEFPEYVCICYDRMLYKRSVQDKLFVGINQELTEACRTDKTSPDGKEWICSSCGKYIKRNSMPQQANANNLALPDTPQKLCDLTTRRKASISKTPFNETIGFTKREAKWN